MKACLRWQLRVLGHAWWLLLLLPGMALLLGWEAAAVPGAYLRRGAELDPRSALALVLEVRHLFPLAGAVWAFLFIGMDYPGEARAAALSRGYRREQVVWSKYILFLLGGSLISGTEQVFAVLLGARGFSALPAAFLLRCFCLRLLLDAGMMVPSALVCFLAGDDACLRLLAPAYGAALWRIMKSHHFLWLRYADWKREELWVLWPLAALVLGTVFLRLLCRRERNTPRASGA